ncbi:RNA polymerase Rpb3/Rpb11 dimerization domain protein, partial [Opisthorchis viverrini]
YAVCLGPESAISQTERKASDFLLTCKPTDLSGRLTAATLLMVTAILTFVWAIFSWPKRECANNLRVMLPTLREPTNQNASFPEPIRPLRVSRVLRSGSFNECPRFFRAISVGGRREKVCFLNQWVKLLGRISFEKDTQVPNAAIFTLNREDHTVGNMLTCQLLKDPRVLFAGYKAPHPLEHKIVIRVQTLPPTTPLDVFISALKDLVSEVSNIEEQFRVSFPSTFQPLSSTFRWQPNEDLVAIPPVHNCLFCIRNKELHAMFCSPML